MTLPDGRVETREVAETTVATAYFLPEALNITGDLQTQTLHRGIYDAAVFRGQITIAGRFAAPDVAAVKIDPADVQWKDAVVTLAVSDLRGTREGLVLDWGGAKKQLQPGSQLPGTQAGSQHHWQPTSRLRPTLFPLRSISMAAVGFSSLRSVCKIRCH